MEALGIHLPRLPELAAILAIDVVGFSRVIEAVEEGTLGRLKALRRNLSDPKHGCFIRCASIRGKRHFNLVQSDWTRKVGIHVGCTFAVDGYVGFGKSKLRSARTLSKPLGPILTTLRMVCR
jgi:hypothetical protein